MITKHVTSVLCACCLAAWSLNASGAPAVTNGLVAYWDFEGITKPETLMDKTGNGHNAIASGAIVTQGKFGQGFKYDGASATTIPNFDFAGVNGAFTISAWLRAEASANPVTELNWIVKSDSFKTPFLLHFSDDLHSGVGIQTWYDSGRTNNTNGVGLSLIGSPKVKPRDGKWHYMGVSATKERRAVFLDGVRVALSDVPITFPTNSNNILIGGENFNYQTRQWVGDIDEVTIHNRALNDDEMRTLYRGTKPVSMFFGPNGGPLLSGQVCEFALYLLNQPTAIKAKTLWIDGANQSPILANAAMKPVSGGVCFILNGISLNVGTHTIKAKIEFTNNTSITKTVTYQILPSN